MNLILMKTKVDHLNAWWEPHATSTPLKKIPPKLEIQSEARNRVLVLKDSVNVPGKLQNARNAFGILQEQPAEKSKCVGSKRSRKGRLSTYFDLSSSSEDDSCEIKKRPIIKLGTKETNTKMLLRNKESNNEGISTFNLRPSRSLEKNPSIKNNRKTRKNISETSNKKNQNDQIQSKKNKTQAEVNSFTEGIFTNSEEENKIFSNSKINISLLKGNESFLEKKVNSINYSRYDENSRHPSEFNEIERKKLKKTPKASHIRLKSKQTKISSNKNPQATRNYQKIITNNNNNLSKFPKANVQKISVNTDSLINRTRNSASKKGTSTLRQTLITETPLLAFENKLNQSHQLFSESREQECINILDLKSDEDDICAENKGQEKLKIKNQAPRKHFTLKDQALELTITTAENESDCRCVLPKNESQTQIKLTANAEKMLKGKDSKNDCKKKNCILRSQKDENETKQEPVNVTEKETAADDPKGKNFKSQLVNNDAVNCSSSRPESTNSIQSNEVHTKDALKCAQEKASKNSVFKQLDKLSFNENGSGCSAVQCWSVNNVKCGVFKLKIKAQVECQTLHSNSHLGGVLVKGHLKMKIGIKEQELIEGDMVFVPPLTKWRATNIGDCESVFYYWCGRFGS